MPSRLRCLQPERGDDCNNRPSPDISTTGVGVAGGGDGENTRQDGNTRAWDYISSSQGGAALSCFIQTTRACMLPRQSWDPVTADADIRTQHRWDDFRLDAAAVVNAISRAAVQPLGVPTDELCVSWKTWWYGGLECEYAFKSESSLPPHSHSHGLRLRERSQVLRHTQPRDINPKLSSGEETAGESKVGERRSEPRRYVPQPPHWDVGADDEEVDADDGEWIDEDVGNEDITMTCCSSNSIPTNPEKRRRRWKVCWEALLHAFHALDREMDTTLVLLALSHSRLRAVASRAIRRDLRRLESSDMKMASRRCASCSPSHLEQLERASSSLRDGSPSSGSDVREEDLCRALYTVIGSLHAIGSLYKQRERRWVEEKQRLDADKDKVQLVLKQVLGVGVGNLIDTTL
ncbi:hypothetical protein BGW80DRAFT_1252835 [Lactifluus volemus]|nr:hypothetical protein BGW80DRAFT_1252835 [Lactifluus volemus]